MSRKFDSDVGMFVIDCPSQRCKTGKRSIYVGTVGDCGDYGFEIVRVNRAKERRRLIPHTRNAIVDLDGFKPVRLGL